MSDRVPRRALSASLLMIAGTIAVGLILRLVPMGLPVAMVKHGGSILWALMIHRIVVTVRPRWSPGRSGIAATIIACGIELSQLYHHPALDALRARPIGALLLGRVFSVVDLFVYATAIMIAALAERRFRRRS